MFWANEYCDRETCFALKKLGYPWEPIKVRDGRAAPVYYELPKDHPKWRDCNAYYAFTIYEAHMWLRREFRHHIELGMIGNHWHVVVVDSLTTAVEVCKICTGSYEQALLGGIGECIKHLTKKRDERRI